MKRYLSEAAMVAAIGIAVPASADDYADCCRNCETEKSRAIAQNCTGLRDRALESCKIRYEKAAGQCLAACAQARNQSAQFDQVRARKDAAAAAARAKRAAQTPN